MEKTEISGIYKIKNGILINKDNEALKAYKKRKQKERILDNVENEITILKNDLQEIKNLLKGLVK